MLDRQQTVASVVLEHSECAPVFQRHHIDYCCRGDVTVEQACTARGLDLATLLAELDRAVSTRHGRAAERDPREYSTPALIGHIVATHHAYARKALPFVSELAAKVARVHGERDPRLRVLDAAVRELDAALLPHLDHEEHVLFPAMMAGRSDRGAVARELGAMHTDHLAIGELLARIRAATGDYALPDWACTSYRTLFAELQALESDVLRHVHLENHVLMPRFANLA